MTTEEINSAVQQAMGFTIGNEIAFPHRTIFRKETVGVLECDLPDYCHDLNAIHEAVMQASEIDGFGFQELFQLRLQEIVERRRRDLNREQIGWWMNNATAHQRSEAFLRAIGFWK